MPAWSQTYTYLDGQWLEGNPPIVGPRTHAFWLGSSVFDGARAFDGVAPDLDRHCQRVNRSARAMGLEPTMSAESICGLARGGNPEIPGGRGALHPSDVLGGGERTQFVRAAESGIDPLLPVHLRGAAAEADRRLDHPLALREAARGHHADRGEGRLPLSEQRPRADRGALARLRQLPAGGRAWQCRGTRDGQRLFGQGRRGDDADRQRIVPQWHYPPARFAVAAAPTAATSARRR